MYSVIRTDAFVGWGHCVVWQFVPGPCHSPTPTHSASVVTVHAPDAQQAPVGASGQT
jgi:hypothetical protein